MQPHYELGQILHNNPVGLPTPDYVDALMSKLRREISRIYWNVNQKQWKEADEVDLWDPASRALSYETGIEGVVWRPYYNLRVRAMGFLRFATKRTMCNTDL